MKRALLFLIISALTTACSEGEGDDPQDDPPENLEPPLELALDLCDDSSNMEVLLDSPTFDAILSSGEFNDEQVQRMIDDPVEGPFYMVNLIRYREWAEYPDGRETDLTGREANALYNPAEFLAAIGAQVVFMTEVDNQIDGDDITWETVAIVEYPCPVAFFAMLAHPEFQERAIHKTAGVEKTIVMVTDIMPVSAPDDPDQSEAAYPPTEDDPAFDLIHVMDFHDIAQYEEGSDEPERTGEEAWNLYQQAGQGASAELGHYMTGQFDVQGAFSGDDRDWNRVTIVRMSSLAGFQALLDDPDRQAAAYHRLAALAHNYSMITFPTLSQIPNGGDDTQELPVTEDGTGTLCEDDDDCPGDGVEYCLMMPGSPMGFCTRSPCAAGECQDPYLCCHDCNPAAASQLPFEDSACLPGEVTTQLETMAGCTCD